VLGAEHPVTAVLTMRLASASRELALYRAAEELAQPALAVLERVYGPDDQYVAGALEELGRIEAELGKPDLAAEHLRRAVSMRSAQAGEEAFETLAARAALAALLRSRGELDESERILAAALAAGRRVLPADHPLMIDLLLELGQTLSAKGRAEEAESLLEESRTLAKKRYGDSNWRTALVELRLAQLMGFLDRQSEALTLARRAEETMTTTLGADHPLTTSARNLAARASSS
jgi:tetratricopeptide (TPR) repeat protein